MISIVILTGLQLSTIPFTATGHWNHLRNACPLAICICNKHRILAICHSTNVTSIGNNHPDSINLSHSCKRVVLGFMSSFHKGGTHTYMLHACCKSYLKSLINPKTRDKWAFSSLSFFFYFPFSPFFWYTC